jgi:hypothetical protein
MGGIAERVCDIQDIERIGELFTRKFQQLSGFRPEDLLGTAFFRNHADGHLSNRLHEGFRPQRHDRIGLTR